MKKATTILLLLALCTAATIQAQEHQTTVSTINDNDAVVRQYIDHTINKLNLLGQAAAKLFYDTCNFIEVRYDPVESDPLNSGNITVKGMTLTINDPDGEGVYSIHLRQSDLESVVRDLGTNLIYMDDDSDTMAASATTSSNTSTRINLAKEQSVRQAQRELQNAKKELQRARNEILNASREIQNNLNATDSTQPSVRVATVKKHHNGKKKNKKRYSQGDRTSIAFLWGFNNWGSDHFNGLSGLDGAYDLRTSFSSWQLELQYAFVKTRHFSIGAGIGYESDIYKFNSPLVYMDHTTGLLNDYMATGTGGTGYEALLAASPDQWSSRLVTRYFSLPVTLGLRLGKIHIGLTALPAIGLNTRHTGLKHQIEERRIDLWQSDDISKHLRPYKLDVRLDLRYKHFGIFTQVATSTLFRTEGTPDVYPFKIGFILKY